MSKIQFNFGLRDFNSSFLQTHFYPEDLPEDWRLNFYANEFETIMMPLETLQSEYLLSLIDELEDLEESFYMLLDCSKLTTQEQQFAQSQLQVFLAELTIQWDVLISKGILHQEYQLTNIEVRQSHRQESLLICLCDDKEKLSAKALKNRLLELHQYANKHQHTRVCVYFSDNEYALTHCRDAVLLNDMMFA